MSAAQEPFIPQSSTPDGNRLAAGLRELVGTLVRSGLFLLRPGIDKIITPRAGVASSLKWGVLNRVHLTADAAVQLPRLQPEVVGIPLKFVLTSGHVIELVPTGTRLSDSKSRPLVNNVSTLLLSGVGVYTLDNDGQNWFAEP